jgi:hypothetical protein
MILNPAELTLINLYLEGFFFGKICVLCALTCTLAKEVHLFLGLGIYTGIFAIYLQCPSKESRTAIIVFYILCLLYVLSMASITSDTLINILEVSNNSICKIIIYADAYRCTIASVSKPLTISDISRLYCPSRNKRFL